MNKKIKEGITQAWSLFKYNYGYAPKEYTMKGKVKYSCKETFKLMRTLWKAQKKEKP